MDSTASRIVKARQYAEERDQRIKVDSVEVELHGDNGNHLIGYEQGAWDCSCEEFGLRGICAHVMAIEEVLGGAVQPALAATPGLHSSASRIVKARQYAQERDTRLRAIVGATIRLSHELGISVVAECIETPAQAQLLRDLGCDYGQGYLFSSAQPGDKAQQWLLNNLPVGAGA